MSNVDMFWIFFGSTAYFLISITLAGNYYYEYARSWKRKNRARYLLASPVIMWFLPMIWLYTVFKKLAALFKVAFGKDNDDAQDNS